jgi:CheY-like chemotaxis protein
VNPYLPTLLADWYDMKTDRHVLIIDDDQDFVHLMSVYLKRSGYRTSMAADGMQGQRIARTENPDVIIIDYQMPGGNGLLIAERIKASAATSHIPILMLTGTQIEDLEAWATRAGIERVLNKVNLSEGNLVRVLDSAISGALDPARNVDALFSSFRR